MHNGLDGLAEIRAQRRLAVSAQSDVPQLQEFRRQRLKPREGVQMTIERKPEGPVQFLDHHAHVQLTVVGRAAPVHLAIDAVEIAAPVRVHVDPDRQAMGARRDHHVNKPVVQEISHVAAGGLPSAMTRPGFAGSRRQTVLDCCCHIRFTWSPLSFSTGSCRRGRGGAGARAPQLSTPRSSLETASPVEHPQSSGDAMRIRLPPIVKDLALFARSPPDKRSTRPAMALFCSRRRVSPRSCTARGDRVCCPPFCRLNTTLESTLFDGTGETDRAGLPHRGGTASTPDLGPARLAP